jgi:hypothetical protein
MIDERCGPRSSSGDGTGSGVDGQVGLAVGTLIIDRFADAGGGSDC